MKKLLSVVAIGLFVLSGCSVHDILVDDVAVHNGAVQHMNAVLDAEESFRDEYWLLEDGVDTTAFVNDYDDFETAVAELDTFFNETKFASGQEIFKTNYEASYKPFIDGYLAVAKEFTDVVKADGFIYDTMEPYFADLDEKTVKFVEVHNDLIGTINLQADADADAPVSEEN